MAVRTDSSGLHPPETGPGVSGLARLRPLVRRDFESVVHIDAVHTGESKPAYWTRVFRDFVGPRAARGRVGLAAELDGAVVGFLFGDIRAFEFGSEPCGWILEVGVDPRVTRTGIASALLDEACRRLRAAGVSTIRTMVRRNNVPVLTFFRTNGFAGGPYVQLELTAEPGLPRRSDRAGRESGGETR
ncbi:MAG TPA: GNAT family N-acetyltransferase [Vicinamibacterales bacterium]|nr:GNAT family N-acetyltransferase [Vicinamibacterales bacterium]